MQDLVGAPGCRQAGATSRLRFSSPDRPTAGRGDGCLLIWEIGTACLLRLGYVASGCRSLGPAHEGEWQEERFPVI